MTKTSSIPSSSPCSIKPGCTIADPKVAFRHFRKLWKARTLTDFAVEEEELVPLLLKFASHPGIVPVRWQQCRLESAQPSEHRFELVLCVNDKGLRRLLQLEMQFWRYQPQERFELDPVRSLARFGGPYSPMQVWTGWRLSKEFDEGKDQPRDAQMLVSRIEACL